MAKAISRGNRHIRIASANTAILAVAACIFLGGLASLVWAVHAAVPPGGDQPAGADVTIERNATDSAASSELGSEQSAQTLGEQPAQTGMLVYPGFADDGADAATSTNPANAADAGAADADTQDTAGAAVGKKRGDSGLQASSDSASSSSSSKASQHSASKQGASKHSTASSHTSSGTSSSYTTKSNSTSTSKSSKKSSPKSTEKKTVRTKSIRHTAFKRTPVYVTVKHTAAKSKVDEVDGKDVTVWTLCPACGKRHAKSYTQRVLDHYENVYCSACGKKHAKSYTETVRY